MYSISNTQTQCFVQELHVVFKLQTIGHPTGGLNCTLIAFPHVFSSSIVYFNAFNATLKEMNDQICSGETREKKMLQ